MWKKSQKVSQSPPRRPEPPRMIKCEACGELAPQIFNAFPGGRRQGLKICAYCVVTSDNLGPNGCIECGL